MSKRRNTITKLNSILPVPIELENNDHTDAEHVSHVTDCLVGDYHIIGDNTASSYIVWTIKVIINDAAYSSIVLYRRYSEIELFRNKLVKRHPGERIPILPSKDSVSFMRLTMQASWLEDRRRGLQWFLTSILLNPRYQNEVRDFLLLS